MVAAMRARGVNAWAVGGGLGCQAECECLMAEAWEASGGIDLLVNNAAVFDKGGLRELDEAALLSEIQVNLMAPLFLVRAFAARAARGRVVNLLDRRVAGNEAGCLAYLLSKKALADFTRLAALELAPAFTVNGVAPGPVLLPPGTQETRVRDRAGRIPLGARPQPAQVAEAVLFLLKADAITGQVIYVDGGQHLHGSGD